MTKLERARETMACCDDEYGRHPRCALVDYSEGLIMNEIDVMDLGDSREERHAAVASMLLDGEPAS